ncbi:pseudouridine synthase family protein [Artemisia annua]|uniref:Pseudouridine synthase family protein n=1 Tax=Artemisia annua TaxID=35608 RepID=A0A2U1QDF6_ARTAN|nr:pseudouridine synthase family protein [Artemisia annua]
MDDVITELRSKLTSYETRIKELEADNAKLRLVVSNCSCHKAEKTLDIDLSENMYAEKLEKLKLGNCVNGKEKRKKKYSGHNLNSMDHHSQRLVALKIMYFGQRFYGFASEAQMDPTVESELFKALEKTRLVLGDKKGLQYSRCGRTDKGVSSVGQVVALLLRSKRKEPEGNTSVEHVDGGPDEEELDYVRILNGVLPNDIRVMGWCPVPVNFSARFSCLSREYRYFFWRENLNIMVMESSCKRLIGEHDYRNFCKMDAANVHNYKRRITSFDIFPSDGSDQLFFMKIKGSAFLWHQVRCMVAVLFLIGQGLESPDVIDALLDVDKTPRKPQYKMAPEIPLVLQSCEFKGLKFTCSSDARRALQLHLEKECRAYKLQAAIFHEGLSSLLSTEDDCSVTSNKTKKKASLHVPLMSRPTEPSYDERRAKLTFSEAAQGKSDEASVNNF